MQKHAKNEHVTYLNELRELISLGANSLMTGVETGVETEDAIVVDMGVTFFMQLGPVGTK
jgi:hypothetical protein